MKTTKHSIIAACAVLALVGLTGTVAHAAPIASDSMDYPSGPVTTEGGVGWVSGDSWGGNAGGTAMTHPNLQSAGSLSLQSIDNNGFSTRRAIATGAGSPAALAGVVDGSGNIGLNGTTVWMSMILKSTSGLNSVTMDLKRADDSGIYYVSQGPTYKYQWGDGNSGVTMGNQLFMLMRIDYKAGNDDVWYWSNPDLSLGEPSTASATYSNTPGYTYQSWARVDSSFSHIQFRHSGVNILNIDEFRVGTTFADVAPAPIPSGGYASWAGANGVTGDPSQDSNNDGVANGVAYFMNATGLATNPGINGTTKKVTWPNGGNILSGQYGTQFVVQISSDLQTWTDVPVGNLSSNTDRVGSVDGELSYILTDPSPSFARLKVTPTN